MEVEGAVLADVNTRAGKGDREDGDGEAKTRRDVDEGGPEEEESATRGAGDPVGNEVVEVLACVPDLPGDAVDDEVRLARYRSKQGVKDPAIASMDGSTGRGLAYPSVNQTCVYHLQAGPL